MWELLIICLFYLIFIFLFLYWAALLLCVPGVLLMPRWHRNLRLSFQTSCISPDLLHTEDVDNFLSDFNTLCTDVLDEIASFKLKRTRAVIAPWINEEIRAFLPMR